MRDHITPVELADYIIPDEPGGMLYTNRNLDRTANGGYYLMVDGHIDIVRLADKLNAHFRGHGVARPEGQGLKAENNL